MYQEITKVDSNRDTAVSPFGEYNVKPKIKEKQIRLSGRNAYVTKKTMKRWKSSLQGDMGVPMQDSRTKWQLIRNWHVRAYIPPLS